MKRLTFKNMFEEPVKLGTKTGTTRWKDQHIKEGETVAAVTARAGRPAFLVPASEAFEFLTVVEAKKILFINYTEEMAIACGFKNLEDARIFYQIEKPDASDVTPMWFYRFKLAHPFKRPVQKPNFREGRG